MLKEKLLNHEKVIGMHLNLSDIIVGKIAGLAGYDFIWVDMEHSHLSLDMLHTLIIAIKAAGTDVIVRAPQDELTYTKKILEMGPDGIIFPMVKTVEDANRLIASTLYPPYGTRGFGPQNAVDYGFGDVQKYLHTNQDTMCRFIQIEHKDAVACLDGFLENKYIDGYIIGPCDLSGSINELPDTMGEHTTALIHEIVDKVHAAGKPVGLSTGGQTDEEMQHWRDMGIDMLSCGTDYTFVRTMAVQNRKKLEKNFKG